MRKSILIAAAFLATLVSCSDTPKLETLDLSEHGVPLSINAPTDAVVKESLFSVEDLALEISGSQYDVFVQVYDEYAKSPEEVADVIALAIEETKLTDGFKEVSQEDDDGFLYETDVNGNSAFGFFYVTWSGSKQIEFSHDPITDPTDKATAEWMYGAVRQ